MRFWVAASLSILVAGCGGVQGIRIAEQSVMRGTSSQRNVYFLADRAANSTRAVCAEPSPDTATQLAASAELSGSGGQLGENASAEAKLTYATSIVQLAGRTQTVVLARDLLFNACLARANGFITNAEFAGIYRETISLVRDLGVSDKLQSAANAALADVAPGQIAAALQGYGLDREILVTRVAVDLMQKTAAERRVLVERALACPPDASGNTCRASIEALVAAASVAAMQTAIGRLRPEQAAALQAATGGGG